MILLPPAIGSTPCSRPRSPGSQAGHPESHHLASAIWLARGSGNAISVAMQHSCSVCRRLAEPSAALPVHLRGKAKDFGDLVAMDTLTLADTSGNVKLFLNQIDVATRFGIVSEPPSRHQTSVWQAFLSSWASWGGFPKAYLVDGGGEFEREFCTEAEALPAQVYTSAPYAPRQNGVPERREGAWKAGMRARLLSSARKAPLALRYHTTV